MRECEYYYRIHLLSNRPRETKERCIGKNSYQKFLIDFQKNLWYNIYIKKKKKDFVKTLVPANVNK